jgi:ATP adenylyltransferase
MGMLERMWAPWRLKYIKGGDESVQKGCIFCTKPQASNDRDNLILYRGSHSFVIMNLYPYNNGHLMVVPYEHTADIGSPSAACVTEMWRLTDAAVTILGERFNAQGFNVGMNLSRCAGAGIDEHMHIHIVPRWNGDTNFMPVVGKVKVISQGMWEAYDMLKPAFEQLD